MKNLSIFEPQIEKHYAYKKKTFTESNVSNIALNSECETQSEEQYNREISGNKESSIKSSLAIDDLKPNDLKSIEDVDQSCWPKFIL